LEHLFFILRRPHTGKYPSGQTNHRITAFAALLPEAAILVIYFGPRIFRASKAHRSGEFFDSLSPTVIWRSLLHLSLFIEIAVFVLVIISSAALRNVASRPVYHTFTACFNDSDFYRCRMRMLKRKGLPKTGQLNRCPLRPFDNGFLVQ
jgi:hypothetical protein